LSFDDNPTDRVAVAAEKFGQRMSAFHHHTYADCARCALVDGGGRH
jgi:hypothetical protein